jgi:hypothetical protein
MFFVQGKSRAETYRWFSDDGVSDEELRDEAEEWAGSTSQGMLNDHYRYGFERDKEPPTEERAKLVRAFKAERAHADKMLKILGEEKA